MTSNRGVYRIPKAAGSLQSAVRSLHRVLAIGHWSLPLSGIRYPVLAGALLFVGLLAFGFGYGGFGVGAVFPDFSGLNLRLNQHDSVWKGKDTFDIRPPVWSFAGHGAAEAGPVTLGGWGAVGFLPRQMDSIGTELVAAQAGFEVGYPYAPVEEFWLKPCLDLGANTWCHLIHSQEPGQDNYFLWQLAWNLSVAPGLELMGRMRYSDSTYVGVFVKASYLLPFVPPQWQGDGPPDYLPPPDFRLHGFQLQFGLRFGRMDIRPYRM